MASVLKDRDRIKPGTFLTCDGPQCRVYTCAEVQDAGLVEIDSRLKHADELQRSLQEFTKNRK
jgi:hypothetical protein